MGRLGRATLASGLLYLSSYVSAEVASVCQGQVCFKLNIPQNTASSGNGDIFFQISAPSSYEWAALGQGSRMTGSNIFVIYTSGNGNNVTLSPRLASGYTEPSFNSDAQVTLLEGSGVSGGRMTANVRCSNCNSWSGGTANFGSNSGSWVYAARSSGGSKNTDSTSASIGRHDIRSAFNWDYANAKGGNSVNPLLNAAPSGSGSGTSPSATNCVPRPQVSGTARTASATATSGGSGGSATSTQSSAGNASPSGFPTAGFPSDWRSRGYPTASPTGRWGPPDYNKRQEINYCDEEPNNNNGLTPIGGSMGAEMEKTRRMLIAHGVLAALAFVILFPAGAITIRLASFPGVVWFHAAFQAFAYLVYIAAFGLGVYLASEMRLLNNYHPIIGIVVFILLFFQPLGGFLHHSFYKKHGTRTFWSYAHLWVGRIAIALGIINGGLGLKLADSMGMSSKGGIIAYSVIAGVVGVAWIAATVIGERRRSRRENDNRPPKYTAESPTQTREMEHSDRPDVPYPENGHYAPTR